jgi:hypothetical protein
MLRSTAVATFAALVLSAHAQPQRHDGNWLNAGLDAYERIAVTRNANEEDMVAGTAFMSYVTGLLSVHRRNNMTASVLHLALTHEKGRTLSEADRARINTLRLFTPLAGLPDDLSAPQVAATIRKYLAANPAKWSKPADILIHSALVAEFPAPNQRR